MGQNQSNTTMSSLFSRLALAAVLMLTGCSTFNQQWKKAVAQPLPSDRIDGPWQGTWTSQETGHQGALRCLLTPKTNQVFLARFQAKYTKVIPLKFSYTVELQVEKQGDHFKFHGQEDLGALAGGMYHYEGQAVPTNFFSHYKCEMDHGIFQMRRP